MENIEESRIYLDLMQKFQEIGHDGYMRLTADPYDDKWFTE